MCPHCNSLAWDTIESSGRGVVYSFVMPRHPPWPWFEGTYIVALVELEEGTRLVSNLCDVDPADVTIGMPVEGCSSSTSTTGCRCRSSVPGGPHDDRATTLDWNAVEVGDPSRR